LTSKVAGGDNLRNDIKGLRSFARLPHCRASKPRPTPLLPK
jgi:hypothetical protein